MNVLSINSNAVYPHFVLPVRGFVPHFRPVYLQDRVDISFEGKDYKNVKPINLEQAKEISGIHCPGCGIKMLSKGDFDNLVLRAENINSTEEFVELLKEYRKFIPTNMRNVLSHTDNLEDYQNKSVREYYNEHRTEAFIRKRERVHRAMDFLTEYAQNIDSDMRDDFLEKVQALTSKDPYTEYKKKILYLTQNYNIPKEEQNLLKRFTLKDVASADNYFNIYNFKNFNEISDNDIVTTLVRRIFSHSVSDISDIHRYPNFIDHPHNKLLLCKNCLPNTSKYVFWKSDTNPKLKDNITKYLSDIAKLMGENKIDDNKRYIDTFCHLSNIMSSGKIHFDDIDLAHIHNLRLLSSRHEEFTPIMQTKVDIPCAQCGSVMLPHSLRSDIQDELTDCRSLDEYTQVLKKYYKYIGHYSHDFAEEFIKITENNPDISKEDFIQIFKKNSNKILIKEIDDALKRYDEQKNYIYTNRTAEEIALYNKVRTIVSDYIRKGKLDNFNYTEFFTECFGDINLKDTPKSIIILISDINKICYKASLINVNKMYNANDNEEIYTILFNLFKSDVATANHLIAPAKGGKNDKSNLIALCKSCSTLKRNKSVKSWYSQNIDVRKNFLKQIKTINDMSKEGKIEGFDDWAKDISQTMYENTNHIYDIRKNFD